MTILIKLFTKFMTVLAGLQLFSFFFSSIALSLLFLVAINKFTIEVFIIVLAIILKLTLNTSSFLHLKKVNEFSFIKTFFAAAILDLVLIVLPIIVALKHIRFIVSYFNKISNDFTCIAIDADCTPLEPFQSTLFKYLIIYIPIALCAITAFIFNYKRTLKQ